MVLHCNVKRLENRVVWTGLFVEYGECGLYGKYSLNKVRFSANNLIPIT